MMRTQRADAQPIAVWSNLPDPNDERAPLGSRCSIVVKEGCLRHIVHRHVLDEREPWSSLFPSELVARLTAASSKPNGSPTAREAFLDASRILEGSARSSLQRPLAMIYRSGPAGVERDRMTPHWMLVTPEGAFLVIRALTRNILLTSYFPDETSQVRQPDVRWIEAVRRLVKRRTRFVLGVGFVPPETGCGVPVRDQEDPHSFQHRIDIRFVTLQSWGFDLEDEDRPWRIERLEPWSPAPTKQPMKRHPMEPRDPDTIEGDS